MKFRTFIQMIPICLHRCRMNWFSFYVGSCCSHLANKPLCWNKNLFYILIKQEVTNNVKWSVYTQISVKKFFMHFPKYVWTSEFVFESFFVYPRSFLHFHAYMYGVQKVNYMHVILIVTALSTYLYDLTTKMTVSVTIKW